jgi:hypothetical protein
MTGVCCASGLGPARAGALPCGVPSWDRHRQDRHVDGDVGALWLYDDHQAGEPCGLASLRETVQEPGRASFGEEIGAGPVRAAVSRRYKARPCPRARFHRYPTMQNVAFAGRNAGSRWAARAAREPHSPANSQRCAYRRRDRPRDRPDPQLLSAGLGRSLFRSGARLYPAKKSIRIADSSLGASSVM